MNGASTVPPAPPRRRWRSVGAVVAGFVAVFALSVGTDQVLHVLKVYPPWGEPMAGALYVVATGYRDRKSTRLNSSHGYISYAVFCLKKKNNGTEGRLIQIITVRTRLGNSVRKSSMPTTKIGSETTRPAI